MPIKIKILRTPLKSEEFCNREAIVEKCEIQTKPLCPCPIKHWDDTHECIKITQHTRQTRIGLAEVKRWHLFLNRIAEQVHDSDFIAFVDAERWMLKVHFPTLPRPLLAPIYVIDYFNTSDCKAINKREEVKN